MRPKYKLDSKQKTIIKAIDMRLLNTIYNKTKMGIIRNINLKIFLKLKWYDGESESN